MDYLHAHIASSIVDNSVVTTNAVGPTEATTGTILYAPFFAEKGRDNTMLTFNDLTSFVNEYGAPNFRKYGPLYYNIARWLGAGGSARVIRLLPPDAVPANSILSVSVAKPGTFTEKQDGSQEFVETKATTDASTGKVTPAPKTVLTTVNKPVNSSASLTAAAKNLLTNATVKQTNIHDVKEVNVSYYVLNTSVTDTDGTLYPSGTIIYTDESGTTLIAETTLTANDIITYSEFAFDASTTEATTDVDSIFVATAKALGLASVDDLLVKNSAGQKITYTDTMQYESKSSVVYGGKDYPILIVRAKGKGKYGNAYSYSLTINTSYNKTYDFPVYNFSVYETNEDGTQLVEGPYLVALKPDAATKAGTSLAITSVVNQYSNRVEVEIFNEGLEALTDALDSIEGLTVKDPTNIDFISAIDPATGNSYKDATGERDVLIYDSEAYGAETAVDNTVINREVGVSALTKFTLQEGTDGMLPERYTNAEGSIFTNLLQKAFGMGGYIDDSVTQVRMYPIDVLLDADLAISVKRAMQDLRQKRNDCFVFLDVPTTHTGSYGTAVAWKNNNAYGRIALDYNSALYGQSFKVTNTNTVGSVDVGFSYILADKIPSHDTTYGSNLPMAGARRGMISGFDSMSYNPSEDGKEELYTNQINYAERTSQGTRINSNLTLQEKTSALSNINNVRMIYKIIRDIENISDKYEFEYADSNTLINFQSEVDSNLAEWSSKLNSITGTVYQTPYDAEQHIARVRIDLTFKNILERISIELNVGRA